MTGRKSEDERVRAARLAALLFAAGGGLGLLLLPILPSAVARPLAYLISVLALVCGVVIQLLPWDRWSREMLHVICPSGLALVILHVQLVPRRQQ